MKRWGADERSEERKGVWGKPLRGHPGATDSGKCPIRGLEGAFSARGADERSEERKGVWGKPLRGDPGATDLQACGVYFCGKKAFEIDTRHCSCFCVPKSVFEAHYGACRGCLESCLDCTGMSGLHIRCFPENH